MLRCLIGIHLHRGMLGSLSLLVKVRTGAATIVGRLRLGGHGAKPASQQQCSCHHTGQHFLFHRIHLHLVHAFHKTIKIIKFLVFLDYDNSIKPND